MKIALDQIRDTPRTLSYVESAEPLNLELARGAGDFRLDEGLEVDLSYHRAGLDVFFLGTVRAGVRGSCARCLAEYAFGLEAPVALVLEPAVAAGTRSGELHEEDIGLAQYEGDEIDLTPLVHEQALLALPTRGLCAEECRGLCAQCGSNLNLAPCSCPAPIAAGRLAALETLLRAR